MEQAKKKVDYWDSLRVMAMLGVIGIHVSTPAVKMNFTHEVRVALDGVNGVGDALGLVGHALFDDWALFVGGGRMSNWVVGNVWDDLLRFSVMVFLMIAGAAMLGKTYKSYGDFMRRRVSKIVLPFLFWTVFYIVFRFYMNRPEPHAENVGEFLRWVGGQYLDCGLSQHFWYVYMLCVLYPLIPLAAYIIKKVPRWCVDATLALWMGYLIVWYSEPFRLCAHTPYSVEESGMAMFLARRCLTYLTYFGYMVLGFRLSELCQGVLKKRWVNVLAMLLFVWTVAFAVVGTVLLSGTEKGLNLTLQGYFHINTLLQAVALFVLLSGTNLTAWAERKGSVFGKVVLRVRNSLSECSYGIYLAHIAVISTLWSFRVYWNLCPPLWSIPLLVIGVCVISWGVVAFIRVLPGGKRLAG